ncbi:acyl-CoA ligase (AMP-forming), exosortase A system-associated [Pseudorhodoferax sp.]|uniref:acyl-CoA ligase (AMP-forming), exosortase A system-associated n=1 Tax=Pseudorhodoferax sp. TaxID=1993553 RepID=UPI0039E38559
MPIPTLLPHLLDEAAQRWPSAVALCAGAQRQDYAALHAAVHQCAQGLLALDVARGERVAVWLDKSLPMVQACFGSAQAGAVFVPVNPVLRPEQVVHVLVDSGAGVLVTSRERLALLAPRLVNCPALRHVVVTGGEASERPAALPARLSLLDWAALVQAGARAPHRIVDQDMAAILYTSGSTGSPKGVVLSHRNLVAGASSVASYLDNQPSDILLAALPLSFDAGFSQLTTAFLSGACVVLLNYLLPRDVLSAMARERVTGLTAVPPLYIQLAQLEWPEAIGTHLRYFANTGGHMPRETLDALRQRVPRARPFLMYGLTEAFRSTYLPPEQVDRRPDSIGQAIPNAEILVLREDGSPCAVDEPGELVHRGALVTLGYWNDPLRTAERYRPLPARAGGLPLPELAVYSGDTVRRDAEGFLYFIGRRDEMIKSSGYRISPTEVEDIVYGTGLVAECAAFGVPHATLGQVVHLVVAAAPVPDGAAVLAACRAAMPAYMLPACVHVHAGELPRNPNGKIDRAWLRQHYGVATEARGER